MKTESEILVELREGRAKKEALGQELIAARNALQKAKDAGHDTRHEECVLAHLLSLYHTADGAIKGLQWALGHNNGHIFNFQA